ncbi:MAG TPA: hypothetical protein VNS19_04715, partial [Acidimicrobiales bacterium]|nr:hypothetical protein [Acidimicrobiales bacterium]
MPSTTDLSALDAAERALDDLLANPVDPVDPDAALDLSRRAERLGRKALAVQLGVLGAVDDRGLHRADGHASARVFTGHANHLSQPAAKRRDRARRML